MLRVCSRQAVDMFRDHGPYPMMEWATPQFERSEVDRAGRELANRGANKVDPQYLSIINNWRASHSYPLNNFQTNLRNKVWNLEPGVPLVAQRIKRLESIDAKLSRHASMRLSQMQDIGGCRAVLRNIQNVNRLANAYVTRSRSHTLKGEKDYIKSPKPDGYRSRHLIYEYSGTGDKVCYSDLKIEIQLRTRLQHAWATAVEAVGIFTHQALKSNQGSDDWKRFFSIMGAVIASIEECRTIPGTPLVKNQLHEELVFLTHKLNVKDVISYYNSTIRYANNIKDAKYFIITMDFDRRSVQVQRYKAKESQRANDTYTRLESRVEAGTNVQVVLVSVDSLSALKRAYPNYFLDTSRFGELVDTGISGDFPAPRE